jgi:hypothetical protein
VVPISKFESSLAAHHSGYARMREFWVGDLRRPFPTMSLGGLAIPKICRVCPLYPSKRTLLFVIRSLFPGASSKAIGAAKVIDSPCKDVTHTSHSHALSIVISCKDGRPLQISTGGRDISALSINTRSNRPRSSNERSALILAPAAYLSFNGDL